MPDFSIGNGRWGCRHGSLVFFFSFFYFFLFLSLIILITKNALLFDKEQEFWDGTGARLASFKALPTFREIVFKGETFK